MMDTIELRAHRKPTTCALDCSATEMHLSRRRISQASYAFSQQFSEDVSLGDIACSWKILGGRGFANVVYHVGREGVSLSVERQ